MLKFLFMPTSTILHSLPKRHELPTELTWDLTHIYAFAEAWEADFTRVENIISGFEDYVGKLDESADKLLKVLQLRDESGQLYYQVRAYAHLRQSEDNGDSARQSMADRADMLGTRRSAATAFIEPQILGMPAQTLRDFISQEKELELYDYYFETLERRRTHVRSAEVEEVLSQAGEPLSGPANVFTLFNNADIKFPNIKNEDGEEVELTKGRYIQFLESANQSVRQDAFQTMHGEYAKWKNTLAATLSGSVKTNVFDARVRRYESALDAALQPDAIPASVYHNLIATARERLPVLHRYFRLRKKLLKLDQLNLWDLYVPMVQSVEKPVSYEEAKKDVLAASHLMGREYSLTVEKAFDARWIDVPENEGKTSGAFPTALIPRRLTSF